MSGWEIEIHYCTQCRWLLRAAWIAQELLVTFEAHLASIKLVPTTGGNFDVVLNGELIFSRKKVGNFPELKKLKQTIRDRMLPNMPLGHSDY